MFYTSGNPYLDYTDVPSPAESDQFLYPASGDLFTYTAGAWTYAGSIKGPAGPTELPTGADPGEFLGVNAGGQPEWVMPTGAPIVPVPASGICPWPIDPGCLGSDWDTLDPAVQDRAVGLASATLHRLTGYRVGGCPITVRPCKAGCAAATTRPSYLDMMGFYGHGFYPHIQGGVWVNSCGCTGSCSCGPECRVSLPGPVGRVDEVKVDGTVISSTDYRADGDGLLWTGTGDCPFPVCQNMALADTEVGTFSITYLNAWPVDALGAYAAGVLASEFAKACTGGKCRLPASVTAVSRQGISMQIAAGAFPDGFTGIREIDAYIALYNPTPIRQAVQVYSPDIGRVRVIR